MLQEVWLEKRVLVSRLVWLGVLRMVNSSLGFLEKEVTLTSEFGICLLQSSPKWLPKFIREDLFLHLMIDECCHPKTQQMSCKRKNGRGLQFPRFWTENVGDVELPLDVNHVTVFKGFELCMQRMVMATKKWYLDRMLGIYPPETWEPENQQTWKGNSLCKLNHSTNWYVLQIVPSNCHSFTELHSHVYTPTRSWHESGEATARSTSADKALVVATSEEAKGPACVVPWTQLEVKIC